MFMKAPVTPGANAGLWVLQFNADGRLTRAFSGRTRVSRPVLEERTGRATRRAADARRWAHPESKRVGLSWRIMC